MVKGHSSLPLPCAGKSISPENSRVYKCMESFTGNPLEGGCTPIEAEAEPASCTCNNHSDQCDSDGKCQVSCLHNTVGDSCERCATGFYGDATTGTRDDCTRCPCPDGGDCFVNEQNLVECSECPAGKQGITCEEDISAPKEETAKEENR
ncbi:laminin EGF-like protein [Cooperia oncophora]